MNNYNLRQSKGDSWIWRGEPNGRYSVKSSYIGITEFFSDNPKIAIMKAVWKLKVLPNINFLWCSLDQSVTTFVNIILWEPIRLSKLDGSSCGVRWYIWMIWKTRNDIILNSYEFHLQKLPQGVLFHSWSWVKAYDDSFCYSFSQWCLNTGAGILGV